MLLPLLCLKKKHRQSLPARFLCYKNPPFKPASVHFHAASFGEIMALKPILSLFDDKAISVITQTGFNAAKKLYSNVRYLPFESILPFWLKKSKVLVIFEAELWLMLVFIAKIKGAKVMLINARISDRSYQRYFRFRFFYKKIFSFIDAVYAQSQTDALRLSAIGAKNIKICGNIKAAFLPKANKNYAKTAKRIIILASTHEGEESELLKGISPAKDELIIIAPRHPERFELVGRLASEFASKNGLCFFKFSQLELKKQDSSGQIYGLPQSGVLLLNALGELVSFYAISDVAVLGGSFNKNVGGHNPIEAAQFGVSIISGEHFFNQKPLYELVSGIKIAAASEVGGLLRGELKASKIINQSSGDEIIAHIRRESGEGL